MTEQQAYEVLEKYPDFELRRYPEHLVAETEVGGAFELAGNVAFPRLARYIGGHNRSSRKMAMTAPVVQQQDPQSRRYVVGFVMPADLSAEDLPDPVDSTCTPAGCRPRQPPRCGSPALVAQLLREADRAAARRPGRCRSGGGRRPSVCAFRPALDAVVPAKE